MKKLITVFLIALLAFSCFANGSKEEEKVQKSAVELALEEAETLTWDELLAKAKAEIGDNPLVLRGASGELDADVFTNATGIKLEFYKLNTGDMQTKVETDIGAGVYIADVIENADARAVSICMEENYLENFVPYGLRDTIPATAVEPFVYLYSNRIFMYNNGNGTLKNQFKNIWEFAEPGNSFEIKSPLLTSSTMNWLITLTKPEWQERLATAYKDFYGKEWKNDGTFKNISYEWIYKAIKNMTFNDSDGTIVSNLKQAKPGAVGFAVLTKLKNAAEINVPAYEGIEGFAGYMYPSCLCVASNAKYPYAAALFITFLSKEEGFNNLIGMNGGVYSSNPAVPVSENAKKSGDKGAAFWYDCQVVEDTAYVDSVYAEAYVQISEWLSNK